MEQSHREVAQAQWVDVDKVRQGILKKIIDLKNGRGNINHTSRLEEIENLMKEFRLACMQVTFHDFEYAAKVDVETPLWQAHVFLNGEYRSVRSRLGAQNQAVQKRKVDKLYRDFLKTSGFFYRGYIQHLSSRFHIPELCQAAKGLGLDLPKNASEEFASPHDLRSRVPSACYTTLVRLGDLSRYRANASDKLSQANFDAALAYYRLANMLDPDDGSCHHQMAVLYQLKSQHLEIIYYFQRAISIAKPYQLAPQNLERGLKSLLNQSNTRHGPVKSPTDMMTGWFLELHAHYSAAKAFKKKDELEKEILHRLDLAIKTDWSEQIVLRMLLVNIAAYDIAVDRVKATWSIERAQCCQNVLSFGIRTANVLIRHLNTLLGEQSAPNVGAPVDSNKDDTDTFPSNLDKLLGFFRIYTAWLYVARADFAQYHDYLEPHISEVYPLLANTLTLLVPYVDANEATVGSKYLLPEDVDAIGLKPLTDRKLPLFLNVELLPGSNPPKSRKTVKPRKEAFGREYAAHVERIWRIRDILCCGVYLAGSGEVPIAMTRGENGSESWYCTDESSGRPTSDETSMTRILAKLKINMKATLDADAAEAFQAEVHGTNVAVIHLPKDPASAGVYSSGLAQSRSTTNRGKALPETAQRQPLDSDLTDDSDMIDMVNKLVTLEDDDSVADNPQPRASRSESSYEMRTSSANEIFGPLAPIATAQLPSGGRAIPNLPWYSYSPTANEPGNRPTSANTVLHVPKMTRSPDVGTQSASPTRPIFDQYAGFPNTYRFPTAFTRPSTPFENQRAGSVSTRHGRSAVESYPNPGSPDFTVAQRIAALDNLSAQLRAQYGNGVASTTNYGGDAGLGSQSPDFAAGAAKPMLSNRGHGFRLSGWLSNEMRKIPTSITEPRIPNESAIHRLSGGFGCQGRVPSASALASVTGLEATGLGERSLPYGLGAPSTEPTSPGGSSYGFQRHASPLNPGARASYSPSTEQYVTSFHRGATVGNFPAFSTTDSLLQGSQSHGARDPWNNGPSRSPSASSAPPETVGCNGNWYNATTPFGRSGPVNNRDDTYFQGGNQLH